MSDRPLRCRIGWHSWYRDCALVNTVQRCNFCPAVDDPKAELRVSEERARIEGLPAGASVGDMYLAALGITPRPWLTVRPRDPA